MFPCPEWSRTSMAWTVLSALNMLDTSADTHKLMFSFPCRFQVLILQQGHWVIRNRSPWPVVLIWEDIPIYSNWHGVSRFCSNTQKGWIIYHVGLMRKMKVTMTLLVLSGNHQLSKSSFWWEEHICPLQPPDIAFLHLFSKRVVVAALLPLLDRRCMMVIPFLAMNLPTSALFLRKAYH